MAQKWNSKVPFNKDNYILRCVEAEFGPSKSSNKPMITLGFEIAAPQEMQVGDESYIIAGLKTKKYYVTQSINEKGEVDIEKTESLRKQLEELYNMFGISFEGFNPENVDVSEFKGKLVHALLSCNSTEERKSPTREQLLKGQRQGDIIKNPVTGKPMIKHFPQIDEFYGLATETAGGQF